jgi:hypothetical protein
MKPVLHRGKLLLATTALACAGLATSAAATNPAHAPGRRARPARRIREACDESR